MAPDVIDLVSSSPPLRPAARQSGNKSTAAPHGVAEASRRELVDRFSGLSDDFEDIDVLIALDAMGARGSKRRRISGSPILRAQPQQAGSKTKSKTNTNAQSELSSPPLPAVSRMSDLQQASMEAGRRANQPSRTSLQPASSTVMNKSILLPALDSDPFRSSPPPSMRQKADKEGNVMSSDPFASSPGRAPANGGEVVMAATEHSGTPGTLHRQAAAPNAPPVGWAQSSDPFASSPPPQRNVPKRTQAWDPISSSAPETTSRGRTSGNSNASKERQHTAVINIDDDSDCSDTSDDLPDIAQFHPSKNSGTGRNRLRRTHSDVSGSRNLKKAAKPVTKRSSDERARDREMKLAQRETEKEQKRKEREQAREAKVREKERVAALAEVNKLRTDKKVSVKEMIVGLPTTLPTSVRAQAETLLDGLSVQYCSWQSPVSGAVTWRRKITSRYDEDLGHWEPIPPRVQDEKQCLIVIAADEVVQMAIGDDIDSHANSVKRHFPGYQVIYLIEGMTAWMRKNRNLRNRQFTAGVRSQEQSADGRQPRRANNPTGEYVSEDLIEDALLQLQVIHDVLIHHTTASLDTAQWIVTFTQHISTVPYRKQKDDSVLRAGFCMETGQVKTGDDARDTYVRMLQEITRVTAPIAHGVATEFGTVSELVAGLEGGGPGRLEHVQKCANKDGAFSERTIGQAVSKRLHKIFTGRDETSTDV